jgi:chromosome segregation ATPase
MQKEKEDREKVYHTGAEARAIRLETKLEEATIREREAKKTEELSKKLIYEKEKKITELLNKLKTEEKKEKEKMWERESLEAKNTIQELQQMLDKRCEDIVTHQNAFNRLNIEQESLKKQMFGLEIMLRAQTVQLQQLQETLQSNGISRLISVVGEEKHSNNDVPASPSAAITFASLQPKSVPLSPTSLTSPKSSSSPSSVSRGVGPGESILSQNVTNSLSSAQTITTATTSEVNPTRSTSKITSHASSPQSQFNLAATGSVERRLVLAVRENEKLRLEMIETNEKFLKSEQKKVESRLLLQNVINLFGSLETELSHKFIKLEDELEREDEERVSLVRKIELELNHVMEKWKEEKQKMIQSNNNEHLKQSRKYNNLLNDYDNAQKRIASLDMELQRVVRNAESMNKKLIQTEEKCRDAVRKVSDLNIQVVSCRESEKAAYAALGKIRQRDSRRIAIGNRNIASSSRVMSESRVNQDIEQHQNIMIHNLRIQVSIIFYFFYSHAIIPFC